MTSAHVEQNRDCSDKMHDEQLHPSNFDYFGETDTLPRISSNSADSCDEFGEPDIIPRIGDQYQVQIPGFIGASNYISHNALIASPLPLTSMDQVQHDVKIEAYSEHKNVIKSDTDSNYDILKIGIKSLYHPRNPMGKSNDLSSIGKLRQCGGQGDLMAPRLSNEYWSDAEKAGFLLGLYTFEKNFVEVRRLVETKEMGSILSFYYGEFYGTDVWRKWSEGRKTKSKKCVYGRKIFSGLRQQELLCRILPGLSEECRSSLLEVSKRFGDEKMSLAEYVASLKAMIGMSALVGAVGIGTGKQDLTRMAMEPPRSNQAVQMRPEIPTGKACSSLTTDEIIKFLSGDYRLSKARSNDLFWEAIWPRLLAKGWHSEQPKDQAYAVGSKHCLVFLVPGVQKFSRWKLVKGDHYFDSVTDVLSKVAKEPELIELHSEEDGINKNQEDYKCTSEREVEENDSDQSSRQRHFYLQPRTPIRNSCATKFTVVDTSLCDGKVREIRSLPAEISNILTYGKRAVMDEDSSDESAYESETISSVLLNASVIDKVGVRPNKAGAEMLPGKKDNVGGTMHQDSHDVSSDISLISLKKKKNVRENKESRKVVEPLLSRKPKKGNKPYTSPTTKQRRKLISGSREETRDHMARTLTSTRLDNEISSCCSGIHDATENFSSEMGPCQNKLASTGSPNGSAAENVECNPNTSIHSTEFALVNPQSQTLIDLNMPQVFPELENGIFTTESSKEQDNSILKTDDQPLPKVSPTQATSEQQQSTMNSLRHGTRNRPPTTKALEARANGYLTVNRRRKSKDTSWREDPSTRPLQRTRVVISRVEASACGFVPSQIEKSENGVFDGGNCYMFGELQALPVANEESVEDKLARNSSPGN